MTYAVDPRMSYVDLTAQHKLLCAKKTLSNFWRSEGFKATEIALQELDFTTRFQKETPAEGRNNQIMVHPLVFLEFLRWTSPVIHQRRLCKALFGAPQPAQPAPPQLHHE